MMAFANASKDHLTGCVSTILAPLTTWFDMGSMVSFISQVAITAGLLHMFSLKHEFF